MTAGDWGDAIALLIVLGTLVFLACYVVKNLDLD